MSKYNSRRVSVGGITFDSIREAKRFQELHYLQRVGAISELELQVKFELIPAQYETYERYGKRGQRLKDGKKCVERAATYVADFVYQQGGQTIVEDAKGYRKGTAYDLFVIKRKLMLERHGIKVREV